MELLKEICGLLKIRQSVYNRVKAANLKPGEAQILIQDCEMGDWVVGPCSSTCVDALGNPVSSSSLVRRFKNGIPARPKVSTVLRAPQPWCKGAAPMFPAPSIAQWMIGLVGPSAARIVVAVSRVVREWLSRRHST